VYFWWLVLFLIRADVPYILPALFLGYFFVWILINWLNNGKKTRLDVRLASWANALALLILFGFIIILLDQLAVLVDPQGPVVVTGWVKMQPLTPRIAYQNTSFTASFTNALSTAINLTGITMNETISGIQCNSVKSSPDVLSSVKAGETFTVTGVCPQKVDGDAYDLIVKINYCTSMGGITTNHTDTGHIKGWAEPL
jgi:hypothetical protein